MFKIVILTMLAIILFNLGHGMYFLIRGQSQGSTQTVRALTWRIGLSLALFIFLCVAFAMGWFVPHQPF